MALRLSLPADNLEWLRRLTQQGRAGGSMRGSSSSGSRASGPFSEDVLLVAGDVSDSPETLQTTLELCVAAFGHVFFVPGNHGEAAARTGRQVLVWRMRGTCLHAASSTTLRPSSARPGRPVGATQRARKVRLTW